MPKVLLSFVGFHDPHYRGAVEGEQLKGPILYLLGLRSFERVYLFSGANTLAIARATAAAIGHDHPGVDAQVVQVDLDDPISYRQIIAGVRKAFRKISAENQWAEFFISTASGTPQMHAAWLLLASSGEIPAVVLQTRPPQYVTTERHAVEVIDLRKAGLTEPSSRAARAAPSRLDKWAAGPVAMRISGEAAEAPAESDLAASVDALARLAPAGPSPEELLCAELGIVGRHPAFLEALSRAAQFARTGLPVLIHGETGTGKELVANYIHRLSGLPVERIHAVNCAGLPRDLAESLLFGHRKGAFTGAIADQKGAFELANGGTLFLDEIGELPLELQPKLLRVLQDGLVQPLGAPQPKKLSVRLVAATNRDLRAMVKEKTFREDLYYRIEVGTIRLPPLRERRSDIPLLAQAGLENANKRISRSRQLSSQALVALSAREWPGNVRGLMNVIERTVQLCPNDVIDEKDLQFSDDGAASTAGLPEPHLGFDVQSFLDTARRKLFDRALELAEGSQAGAARLLGVTPQAVGKYMRKED